MPSDGYCGFHSIVVHLYGTEITCTDTIRENLARATAEFVFQHWDRADIKDGYLQDDKSSNSTELKQRLKTEKRWLSVHDLRYILEAHGKQLALITENVYLIYNPARAHILIKDNHYEPMVPIVNE